MKVLVVEPWLVGSHRAWAEGFAAASANDVRVVGLPGVHWRWRLAGSAAPLAAAVTEVVRSGFRPDVLLVSGLTDVAQLQGFLRRIVPQQMPVAVYQHESQLLYPIGSDRSADRAPALVNWLSWMSADAVFFNSNYHRSAVVECLPAFLDSLPDRSHHEALASVLERFDLLPLGVDLSWTNVGRSPRREWPVILWPHRWEPDKDPLAFGRALDRLVSAGLDHRVVLAGGLPTVATDLRQQATERHRSRILADGPFSRADYRRHLLGADIVVSCARHDFFGAAIVEAVAAGSAAVVPAALAYPETLGPDVEPYVVGRFGSALEEAVKHWHGGGHADPRPREFVHRHGWDRRVEAYDSRLAALAAAHQ